MSYTSRHRYKTRREKFQHVLKKSGLVLVLIAITLIILAVRNWQSLKDWYYVTFG
jgi:uncharacterized membrane protein YidH (DUF202 family)